MKDFKDFNITIETKGLIGEKIQINKLLNVIIQVIDFKVEDSIHKPGTKCLHMQVFYNNENRVVFVGAKYLIQVLNKIPEDGFPFRATIENKNNRLEFT